MLNRSTPSIRNDSHPQWGIIQPQTTNLTIHDGSFTSDNRTKTRVYNNHRKTISDSYNRTVFNAPIQGYVQSAKNAGTVNGYVQITNVQQQVGARNPRIPNTSPVATAGFDTTLQPLRQMVDRRAVRNKETGDSLTAASGDSPSSPPALPDLTLQQELRNLSPNMRAFVKSLQQRRENVNTEGPKRIP